MREHTGDSFIKVIGNMPGVGKNSDHQVQMDAASAQEFGSEKTISIVWQHLFYKFVAANVVNKNCPIVGVGEDIVMSADEVSALKEAIALEYPFQFVYTCIDAKDGFDQVTLTDGEIEHMIRLIGEDKY